MITLLSGEVGAIWNFQDRLSGRVIDLGGGMEAVGAAEVVVDITYVPEGKRLVKGNLCDPKVYQQFSDKEFDWVWCNHTLEDLYDPFIVLENMQRIAKHGLIGTPHWTREITTQSNREDWERVSGWPHHFWYIGINRSDGYLEFFPKLAWAGVAGDREYVTANLNFEWDGGDLPYRNCHLEYHGNSLRAELVMWLEQRWMT